MTTAVKVHSAITLSFENWAPRRPEGYQTVNSFPKPNEIATYLRIEEFKRELHELHLPEGMKGCIPSMLALAFSVASSLGNDGDVGMAADADEDELIVIVQGFKNERRLSYVFQNQGLMRFQTQKYNVKKNPLPSARYVDVGSDIRWVRSPKSATPS